MKVRKRMPETREFPYYKIQYWDGISMCWSDVPKTFPDPEKAEAFVLTLNKRFGNLEKHRIMEVSKRGRKEIKKVESEPS